MIIVAYSNVKMVKIANDIFMIDIQEHLEFVFGRQVHLVHYFHCLMFDFPYFLSDLIAISLEYSFRSLLLGIDGYVVYEINQSE